MKYKLFLFCLICFCGLKAQKTTNYFQYGLFPNNISKDHFYNQRVQIIDKSNYFLMLENSSSFQTINCSLDSILIGGANKMINKGYKLKSNTNRDQIILYMKNDTIIWSLSMSPSKLKSAMGNLYTTNTLSIGNDLLILCYCSTDTMHFFNQSKIQKSINLPDTSGYALFRITKDSQIILENYIIQGKDLELARLIWASEKKYSILFPYYSAPIYPVIPNSGRLADTQVTATILQFEFGNKTIKNWISGTIPAADFNRSNNVVYLNNQVLLAGSYEGINRGFFKFPYQPVYKINNEQIVYPNKPFNFNRKKNYIFWMKIDMENWKIEETEFAIPNDVEYFKIKDCGILKNGYWVQGHFDSVAVNALNPPWQKCNSNTQINLIEQSIFTYNPKDKTINTTGFPNGTSDVFSDGDSLIFLYGNNTAYFKNAETYDFDKSIEFRYPIMIGKYVSQHRIDGNLIWARNDNLRIMSNPSTMFSSKNNVRFVSAGTFIKRLDLDYGFRYLRSINVGDAISGTVTQLSKAPICDFDIENITYNHVTINYKGALNANFYYKYGDGSKDSNYNQRNFIHSYKKTGTFLLYCIAKNDFGRDTAYYSVDIYDIVSTTKLQKNSGIQLYPNPTASIVKWDEPTTTSVDIFNTTGSLVERIQTTESQVNIEHLPKGTYFISVHSKNGAFCNKVVKE